MEAQQFINWRFINLIWSNWGKGSHPFKNFVPSPFALVSWYCQATWNQALGLSIDLFMALFHVLQRGDSGAKLDLGLTYCCPNLVSLSAPSAAGDLTQDLLSLLGFREGGTEGKMQEWSLLGGPGNEAHPLHIPPPAPAGWSALMLSPLLCCSLSLVLGLSGGLRVTCTL